jgi:hypothetical protein
MSRKENYEPGVAAVPLWSLAPRHLSVSPEARADNRPWIGQPYLRRRPISPITAGSPVAGLYFL